MKHEKIERQKLQLTKASGVSGFLKQILKICSTDQVAKLCTFLPPLSLPENQPEQKCFLVFFLLEKIWAKILISFICVRNVFPFSAQSFCNSISFTGLQVFSSGPVFARVISFVFNKSGTLFNAKWQ